MEYQLGNNIKLSVTFGNFFDKTLTILPLRKQTIEFVYCISSRRRQERDIGKDELIKM